jgi:hypothetical protein
VIGRILAAVFAVALVAFAAVAEPDSSKLGPQRTAAQIAKRYGPGTKASCEEKRGYWDYKCRVHRTDGTFSIDVRVDDNGIVERSGP